MLTLFERQSFENHYHCWAKKGTQTLTKNRLVIGCRIEKSKHTTLTSVKSTTIYTCYFISECQCLLKGDHLKISVNFGQKKAL